MATASYEKVTKRFGNVVAVSDLDLEIDDGEFVVLVGPSGSGKTTALRLLAGLESLSGGTLRIDGRIVNDVSPRDRDIAMVFQDYALYPQMTVFQNLAFALRIRKLERREIERKVTATAESLGLGELLPRKPRELSGGQQQRVALGRALVREPKVFLMDEPLSNLDAQLRTQTRGEIRRLQQSLGITTVYVTHDQIEAMTMGDRVVVMKGGLAVQVGPPHRVYEEPETVFVARFIGSPPMAFATFAARVGDGTITLTTGDSTLEAKAEGSVSAGLPAEVLAGVRPEHTGLWADGSGLIGPLEGRVRYVEDLGRERFVGVEIGPDATFVVLVPGDVRLELDERVRFGLRPGHLHLFDPRTERALGRV